MRLAGAPSFAFVMLGACVPAHAGDGPLVSGATPLDALPATLAAGPAGPFNRVGFDLQDGASGVPLPEVACLYPGGFAYRCDVSAEDARVPGARRRLVVVIPDLGKGSPVTLRIRGAHGRQDVAVALANTPRVIREIEALALRDGGKVVASGKGPPAPDTRLLRTRATSTPALATSPLAAPPACDKVFAQWVSASATDPVFASAFGPLNGSILAARPVAPGSPVRADNVPEWLVTFPASATRVQFIAHYEVIYRVGECPHRIMARPSAG